MNESYEGNASAAMAVDADGGSSVEETTELDTGEEVGNESFIVTESYVVPAATPKFHSGSISGFGLLRTNSGSTALVTTLHSDYNGRDYEMKSWLPAAWVENPRISREELAALPRPEGMNAKGNPKQTQLERFGSTISNSRNDADLQKLFAVAKKASRALPRPTYTNIDEFLELLNGALSGTPAVFTTREEKNDDPQYAPKETVSGIFGYDFDTSKLKKYVSAAGN